ncbi:O-antigen ligase family protein [Deinococcus soli (ex Cha et al. 2016)]|uniref:O-antigen ligase family protein n=1 Tax=Deinococcus soli (ex Cha et al. 2016) TaxID=1309411 RepID=UPI001664BF29|nr:hypothetical protein [Deinococcus soli (ex Cha et al. 2016)]
MIYTIKFLPLTVNVIFLFLMSFYVSSKDAKTVQATIYEPRLLVIIIFVCFSIIYGIWIQGRNLNLFEYVLVKIKSIKFSKGMAFIFLASISASVSPMPIVAWMGHDSAQFGTLVFFLSIAILLAFASGDIPSEFYIIPLSCCVFIMFTLTIFESVGFRPMTHWFSSPSIVYPAATIGLRQHLGGWFAIMALQPVFFYRNRQKNVWFYLWISSGLIGAAVCTTSAATIGLLIGLIFWTLSEIANKKLTALIFLIMFILSSLLLPQATESISDRLGNPKNIYKPYTSTTTLKTRLILWKAAARGSADRPLLGWGSQTFATFLPRLLTDDDLFRLYRLELGISDKSPIRRYVIGYEYKYHGKWKHFNLQYIEPHSALFSEIYSRGILSTILLLIIILSYINKYRGRYFLSYISAFFPYIFYLLFWFYLVPATPMYFALLGIAHKDMIEDATNQS